jgi:hypothetical protein
MGWFSRKKEVLTPLDEASAKAGMIAQEVLVNPTDDEQMKADHFRMEHIATYLREKREGGFSVPEHKLKFLISEMKYLAAKIEFYKVKKEVENGDNNPA